MNLAPLDYDDQKTQTISVRRAILANWARGE
jgi:hypothetical protein